MQTRRLGRTDLSVAPLVLGGNVFGWTADKKTSFDVLDRFAAAGLNAIDTADVYSAWAPGNSGGESETIIGEWVKARGNRNRVIIITKVGSPMGKGKEGLKPHYVAEAVEVILRRGHGRSSVRRGTGTIYQLLGSGHGHDIQPALITFEPGGGYDRDRIGHVGEEFAFVVLGDVELLHGDHTYVLGPGDSVRFWASLPHAYRNASQTDVAFMITVATPPW